MNGFHVTRKIKTYQCLGRNGGSFIRHSPGKLYPRLLWVNFTKRTNQFWQILLYVAPQVTEVQQLSSKQKLNFFEAKYYDKKCPTTAKQIFLHDKSQNAVNPLEDASLVQKMYAEANTHTNVNIRFVGLESNLLP